MREEARKQMEEIREQMKETDRITKENAKLIGNLGGRLGDMVEHLVAPNLKEKFRELGVVFEKTTRNSEFTDAKNNFIAEVDITLENGENVMLVEVKSKLTIEDIAEHIERIGKVRAHADLHGDRRKFLGAVAGMGLTENERTFAFKSGFYVIEPAGETFAIRKPEGIYSIREW
jgi:predicted AAA+ superfamily ATPase